MLVVCLTFDLLLACSGGQTSIGAHDFGRGAGAGGAGAGAAGASAAGGAAAGAAGAPCNWSDDAGLIAEWHANGNLQNEVSCSPLQAEILGQVGYGLGRAGQAWQIRSTWSMVEGGDPNYVNLARTLDFALDQLTVDAWVQQTSFNDYNNSNRLVFSTSYRSQTDMLPGEAQIYLHENKTYLGFLKTGPGNVLGEDWAGCYFASLSAPEMLAPLDTWFRVTLTYDGTALRCYRDGVLDTETPVSMMFAANPDLAPLIGRNYPGDVDALRLFNRALSASELAAPWP